jgi:quinol monooxygenase YgiN
MSEQVVYVDRFQLREGKLEDFRRYATEVASFVQEREPGVVSFNYYIDEAGEKGTALFIFSSAEALDRHLELVSSKFQEGYELLRGTEIELLGQPSNQATAMAASFNASLKTNLAGFTR